MNTTRANTKSANYKLITALFGEYISQYKMSKAQLKKYYTALNAMYA